jgi:hypothetical protein
LLRSFFYNDIDVQQQLLSLNYFNNGKNFLDKYNCYIYYIIVLLTEETSFKPPEITISSQTNLPFTQPIKIKKGDYLPEKKNVPPPNVPINLDFSHYRIHKVSEEESLNLGFSKKEKKDQSDEERKKRKKKSSEKNISTKKKRKINDLESSSTDTEDTPSKVY